MHVVNNMEKPSGLLKQLLKVLCIFKISIWYDKYNVRYALGIKFINYNKIVGYELEDQTLKEVINVFVTDVVFQHVGISWIIESNEKLRFNFERLCTNQILNWLYYNTAVIHVIKVHCLRIILQLH